MKKDVLLGWVTGLCIFTILFFLLPEIQMRCADGWASASIGRQGACSHHGGVAGWPSIINTMLFLASLGISCVAGIIVTNKFSNEKNLQKIKKNNSNFYQNEIFLINEAIQKNKKIEFTYKKSRLAQSEIRRINPIEFEKFPHRDGSNSTLCITGFCQKRRENRSFALKKLSNLRIII